MGAVVSCVRYPPSPSKPRAKTNNQQIKSVFRTIGNCIMTIVNAIAAGIKAIINAIVSLFSIIINCLTCRGGRKTRTTHTSRV
jgi:hypothetical protein